MICIFCESSVYCGDVVTKHKELAVDKLLPSMNELLMRYIHTAILFTFMLNTNYCSSSSSSESMLEESCSEGKAMECH